MTYHDSCLSVLALGGVLVALLLTSCFDGIFFVGGSVVDRVLGMSCYFHRNLSGVGGYRVLNSVNCTLADNNTVVKSVPVGVWEVGDGWVSGSVPRSFVLARRYNFLFGVWGAGSGNATLFFKFYVYRGGVEHFLFVGDCSPQLLSDVVEMLWQHSVKEVSLSVKKGDRLVLRLFLNVTVGGVFGLGYDCVQYPSCVSDPAETRFMQNSEHTVNTVSAYKLFVSESDVLGSITVGSAFGTPHCYYGIKVAKVSSSGDKTYISSGVVAVVDYSYGTTASYTATGVWSCSETALSATDAVLVELYANVNVNPPTVLRRSWITEQLNASKLDSADWSVKYRVRRVRTYIEDVGYEYVFYFRHGISGDSSYIGNFSWSEVVPVQYSLTISCGAGGYTVPASGTYLYDNGSMVSVSAVGDGDFVFDVFVLSGENHSENPIVVTMYQNYTLMAYFRELTESELSDVFWWYVLLVLVVVSGLVSIVCSQYPYRVKRRFFF